MVLKGNYKSEGRVLILPIVGDGDCEIVCSKFKLITIKKLLNFFSFAENIAFKYAFDLKPVEKKGQIYAELHHVKLDIKPELVQFQFNNLFNGDKALGDNMNKFMNDNWHEIYQELEPSFTKALSLISKQMINNVFAKQPYETFFV